MKILLLCVSLVLGILLSVSSSAKNADTNGWKTDRLDRGYPIVYHQAMMVPRLAVNTLTFECDAGAIKVETIGLQPLQKFPQPELQIHLDDEVFSRIATAEYVAASKPSGPIRLPQEKLDDNLRGKELSWPGHPAYSRLNIKMRMSEQFFSAFARGGSIKLAFADQEMAFPKLGDVRAKKFVELCRSKVNFAISQKDKNSTD